MGGNNSTLSSGANNNGSVLPNSNANNSVPPNSNANNSVPPESNANNSEEELFKFKEDIDLKDFMGKFDEGINTFNENIHTLRVKQREFDDNSNKIKKRINNHHKKNTYERGSYLLTEKINFYDYWIDMLYGTHKIMIVILCIIVVIMLIYKLMNKSN